MDWQPVQKPAEMAESRLLEAILSGHFPINSNLPGERELAAQIGVTRPTLREALQRLARDGWLDIQHGKPTRVRDYWRRAAWQSCRRWRSRLSTSHRTSLSTYSTCGC